MYYSAPTLFRTITFALLAYSPRYNVSTYCRLIKALRLSGDADGQSRARSTKNAGEDFKNSQASDGKGSCYL